MIIELAINPVKFFLISLYKRFMPFFGAHPYSSATRHINMYSKHHNNVRKPLTSIQQSKGATGGNKGFWMGKTKLDKSRKSVKWALP